jgi:hypothetical protein
MAKKNGNAATAVAAAAAGLTEEAPAAGPVDGDGPAGSVGEVVAAELQRPDLEGMVQELALIDQAIAGIQITVLDQTWTLTELEKFRSKRRETLKVGMNQEKRSKVVDEETNWVGEAVPSFSEVWSASILRNQLTIEQIAQVIIESVDVTMLKALIKRGAISLEKLEAAGAVTKELRSVSLHVKPREANGTG